MKHDLSQLPTDAAVSAVLAESCAEPIMIAGIPHLVRSDDQTIEDFEKVLPAPTRLRQVVTLGTPAALTAYVRLFGDKARSILYAHKNSASFDAVLDYHVGADAPSWNAHRAKLTLVHTQPWKDWTGANKRAMNQTEFAQFIEDHIPDIVEPDGGKLLELTRSFEATKAVTFQSSQRIADGSVQFQYSEDVQGSPKAGQMKMPPEIKLALQPFEGSNRYAVLGRLRYRIGEGGKLALWYDLLRAQDVLDVAFADVLAAITNDTAGSVRAVLEGTVAG
jgi:uncharacterized protein YfdQ (DUF2303 family)